MKTLALIALFTGNYALQLPGTFHAGEPVARNGESWLALHVDAQGARLQRTTLRLELVHDEISDAEGEQTAQRVSASGMDDPLAFIRGPLLRPGPVVAAQIEVSGEDGRADGLPPQALSLGKRRYRLSTRCSPAVGAAGAGGANYRCAILLTEGGTEQTLFEISGQRQVGRIDLPISLGDDASPHLIFAGDLDRDGRLDLIFDTTDHYNVSRPTLFLSGAAKSGMLLEAVAEYSTVGC